MHDRVKPINSFPLFPILYSYENVLFKVYTTVRLTSSLDVPALKPNHIWAILIPGCRSGGGSAAH